MSLLQKYKKFLHVKIPKNGTNSINKVLKQKKLENWNRTYFYEHEPLCILKENNNISDDVFIFCVSRNPFTRFYSLYNQFKKHFHLIDIDINFDTNTFDDFKLAIEKNTVHPFFCAPQTEWISTFKNNMLYGNKHNFEEMPKPFVYNNKILIKNKKLLKLNKIYRIENIEEFEADFNEKLFFSNHSIYSMIKYQESYTDSIIKFVIDYYQEDFKNFGYDYNFEQSVIQLKNQRKRLFYYQ